MVQKTFGCLPFRPIIKSAFFLTVYAGSRVANYFPVARGSEGLNKLLLWLCQIVTSVTSVVKIIYYYVVQWSDQYSNQKKNSTSFYIMGRLFQRLQRSTPPRPQLTFQTRFPQYALVFVFCNCWLGRLNCTLEPLCFRKICCCFFHWAPPLWLSLALAHIILAS